MIKFVPCEVSSPYGTWVWRLELGPAQCIPVTLFTLPLCPALPEGQRLVVFWPLVYPLMNRDGLHSVSSSFSKSFWHLPKTGPGVPVLASWGCCICVESKAVLRFPKLLKPLILLITKSATPFCVSVLSLNILVHYMLKSIWILVNKFNFFNY